MNKKEIIVPAGIRYISDWSKQDSGFTLPDHPCIIDKGLTGCGFTEYCINSEENVILCSPRKMLLENKEQQNPHALYVRNEYESVLEVDKDLNVIGKDKGPIVLVTAPLDYHIGLKDQIKLYVMECKMKNIPAKILVTYDSFRIVKESLVDTGDLSMFRVIVDEFQSIFTDSRFKSETEIEFLDQLRDIERRCYVSATPMMDKYLDELDDFKNLMFYQMNWDKLDPRRLIKPQLKVRTLGKESLMAVADNYIKDYLRGDFKILQSPVDFNKSVESKELIIYVNSVKNICDIIRKSKISPDQVNILCANTSENQRKINKSLKTNKFLIGSIPLRYEPRKMFTFCTRTVYLGADFYSDNARSLVLSDANIDCLAVDITLDLPQILGRQRLDENPWKNRADLYVKMIRKDKVKSKELFDAELESKEKRTLEIMENIRLSVDNNMSVSSIVEKLRRETQQSNYKYDYVAVKERSGSNLTPCVNRLVQLAEIRAFEIQQLDYSDRFRMFSMISDNNFNNSMEIGNLLNEFYGFAEFTDRMKVLCDSNLDSADFNYVFSQIPEEYGKFYLILGPQKIKTLSYRKYRILEEIDKLENPYNPETIDSEIYSEFHEGDRLLLTDIKEKFRKIYKNKGIDKTPNAVDLNNYFEISKTKITIVLEDGTKKLKDGLKLIKKLR